MIAEPRSTRWSGSALRLLAATLFLAAACRPPDGTAPAASGPSDMSQALPSNEPRTGLEGRWWVLAPSLPVHGLLLSIEPADESGNRWSGSWLSFDWRATDDAAQLARPSRPVEISARAEGDEIVIVGPVPQVDTLGRPTGQRGSWELRVTRTSLPGQPLRYGGRVTHSDPAEAVDGTVELVTSFRPWSP